ncbi:MAG: hypothetical protein KA218_02380 [Arenimonas sp.]|nr:hypothetical protein [Arenimonas sp.]
MCTMCNRNFNNCLLVVGATWPKQLAEVRSLVGGMPFLVPGVGAQGDDVEQIIKHGRGKHSDALIISSSRAILYASNGTDFTEASRAAALKQRD